MGEVSVVDSLLGKALPYVGWAIAGVGAWFLTNLYGRSLLRYWEVKQAVCKSLVSYGLNVKWSNTGASGIMPGGVSFALGEEQQRRNDKVEERCRLNSQQAGELVAAFNGLPQILQWWYSSIRGEDIGEARKMLLFMSGFDGDGNKDFEHLVLCRKKLITLLNFKGI